MKGLLKFVVGVLLCVGSQSWAATKVRVPEQPAVLPSLVFEQGDSKTPARVGVLLKIAPGWHIYSQSPGDIGLPTTLDWSPTTTASLSSTQWPAPDQFDYQGTNSSGYSGEVTLWSSLTSSAPGTLTSVNVEARVGWLACKDECQPGDATLSSTVEIPAGVALPQLQGDGDEMRVTLPATAALSAEFMMILWGAFLGGIILNVMPCVFPVLSLKIMGLTMTHDARGMRVHAVAYGVGVLASFWSLAILLNVARLLGASVGWGFQFQSPSFVFCLVMIIFVIALNMMGLFEFGYGIQNRAGAIKVADGAGGAFLSGVLATALATPCTGPFMGSAIAAALNMSGGMTLVVFTALGAGLALPYMLLCWYPTCRRFLPRPGAWMDIFKQLLAFPLFMTVVWLLWVLGCQIGIDGLSRVLASLVIVGLACWGFGRLCTAGSSKMQQRLVSCGALLTCLGAVLIGTPWSGYVSDSSVALASSTHPMWEKFSAERLAALREEGIPVIVDFTAAWCVVCQVNERRVFSSSEIVEPLLKGGAVFMRADWTKRDPEITTELARHGAVGIPLVVVYGKHQKGVTFASLLEPTAFSTEARKLIGVTEKT